MSARRPRFESLSSRLLCAADWQNADWPLDVNDSGTVVPHDVVLVLNDLNRDGIRDLPPRGASDTERPWVDVDGNGRLEPRDALRIINALHDGEQPISVVADLVPELDINGNGVVVGSQVTFVGQTTPGARLLMTLDDASVLIEATESSPVEITATADRQGRFYVPVDLPYRMTGVRIEAENRLRETATTEIVVRQGDIALDWNTSVLQVVREWTAATESAETDEADAPVGTSQPPMVARNMAMIHTAMHDAMVAVTGTEEAYLVATNAIDVPGGASGIAAAAVAAHRVASSLYSDPDEQAIWDQTLDESLLPILDPAAIEAAIPVGQSVADAILRQRSGDGWDAMIAYPGGADPGQWRPTMPGYLPAAMPHWADVTPFAIASGDSYRPPSPPELSSAEYAAALDEVMRLGRVNSDDRTADQMEIAFYWADGAGTDTPPGHWNRIATDVAVGQHRNLAENLRMMALLNLALADAAISAWDTKYAFGLWRPVDAIRHADTDGNASTESDATWEPLLTTPPFPTYTSGHSTFSGSADAVLSALLGAEVAFASDSAGMPVFTSPAPGQPVDHDQEVIRTRQFTSFHAAADEAGRSRIYGGIHFVFDDSAGLAAGRAIGQFVIDRYVTNRS